MNQKQNEFRNKNVIYNQLTITGLTPAEKNELRDLFLDNEPYEKLVHKPECLKDTVYPIPKILNIAIRGQNENYRDSLKNLYLGKGYEKVLEFLDSNKEGNEEEYRLSVLALKAFEETGCFSEMEWLFENHNALIEPWVTSISDCNKDSDEPFRMKFFNYPMIPLGIVGMLSEKYPHADFELLYTSIFKNSCYSKGGLFKCRNNQMRSLIKLNTEDLNIEALKLLNQEKE